MADYYVDPATGDNGGTGAIGDPWETLSYAVSLSSGVTAGDNIYLRAGTYTEFVSVKVTGTAGNPITIQGYTGETATLEGVAGTEGIMIIQGVNYITLGENLYFSYGHAKPGGVRKFPWIKVIGTQSSPTSNIILQDFLMERLGWDVDQETLATDTWLEYGIMVDDATDCAVHNVTIRGTAQGVTVKDKCYDLTITNCDIQYVNDSCITLTTSGGVARRCFIGFNTLAYSASEDGIQFMQDFSLSDADQAEDDSNQGTIIAYNIIVNNAENAIDCKGTTNILIHGNYISGTIGSGNGYVNLNRNDLNTITRGANAYSHRVVVRYNILAGNSGGIRAFDNWKIYNNTCVYNNTDYTGPGSSFTSSTGFFCGVRHINGNAGAGVRNNIFSNHNDADVSTYAGSSQPGTEMDIDYNLYASKRWIDRSAGSPYTTYTTLASWQTRLGQNNWRYGKDANSIAVNNHNAIQFVNVPATAYSVTPDIYDFNLQPSSPAKGAGGPLTFANGAGSSATSLIVDDSTWFQAIGRTDVFDADRLYINSTEVTITAINDATNTITITPAATWSDNAPVYFVPQGFDATATPDMGAGGFQSYSGGGGEPPPPPAVTGSGARSVVRVACATSTGQQTITLTTVLTDTPIAWRFTLTYATVDDTAADHAVISRGWAWDNGGTIVEGSAGIRAEHNTNPSDTSRRTINDGCIMIMNPTSGVIDGQASFVSGSVSDVVIDWTDAPGAAYLLTVEAFSGVEAFFGPFDIAEVVDAATTITTGFATDYIEVVTVNETLAQSNINGRYSHGLCTITSSTPTQACLIWQSKDNVSPTNVVSYLSTADIGGEISDTGTLSRTLRIENITATAFDIATKTGNYPDGLADGFVFALKHTGLSVYSGVVTMPTATDSAHEHAVGFTSGQADVIFTSHTTINTGDDGGAAWGLGMWDGALQYSGSIADQDNVATSNTQSLTDDTFVNLYDHTGAAMALMSVSAVSTDLVGNYSDVDGTARYMILVAVQAPIVATVTADFSADVTTGDAPLTVTFTDASTDENTTITEWYYDFGDGDTSTSQNPVHEYAAAGSYTVSLTVGDGDVSDTLTRSEYIVVDEAVAADISPSPAGVKILTSATYSAIPRSDVQASAQVG